MEENYSKKLLRTLVLQSSNELFYMGNIKEGAKVVVSEVVKSLNTDRASVWLFNEGRDAIVLQQLYVSQESAFYQDITLYKKDFESYFHALEENPIIVANDAETHSATSCFLEIYLRPLGVKSMLDVPIWYKGALIGVICIESLTSRTWLQEEVDFAQVLSSLYSFSYSVKETNRLLQNIKDFENFVNSSTLVSTADSHGKITFVNDRFTKVSGWSLEESLGKDHSIVNSGEQPDGYWSEMYRTVLSGQVWNDIVTNRSKNGELYWVDTFIKANFDDSGKLKGFTSIRQDVTEIVKKGREIEKKNTYLEHAAKILRHDMHSGINTYIPRGLSSLERRLDEESIKSLKIEAPLKMIKEGLKHTQKVYKGVYEFTNLVKKDVVLSRTECDLKLILEDYLSSTAYRPQVIIDELNVANVNEPLFCTAIDNLIRNGLKYNDSNNKIVNIRRVDDTLLVEDNGRGLTREEFKYLSQPYVRKEGQTESGSGLGLNICIAILEEHGFSVDCEKRLEGGTRLKIKLKI